MSRRKRPTPAGSGACASAWSLDKQIARTRRDMGEARWVKLNKEWDNEK